MLGSPRSSVSVGRGVASLGAAAPVGQALSEAAKQASAAQLVAQLQVLTGRPGVYMMYPGPAANGVVMGGPQVGAPLGLVGLHWDLGLGPAGRVAGV